MEQAPSGNSCTSRRPIYFASGGQQLFGWLHLPAKPQALGLVICNPFGYEALCAHQSLRAFAEMAAELGIAALMFDYVGTGDSDDAAAGTDQFESWVRDTDAAVRALCGITGAQQVCVLGLRIGATAAAVVAARCPWVTKLIALAPVTSGRRYLREMRTMRLAATAHSLTAKQQTAAKSQSDESSQGFEVGGFYIESATMRSLATIDVTELPLGNVRDVLIIDRAELPAARGWTDVMGKQGIRVTYSALPGFEQMVQTEPQLAVVPAAMISATHIWLQAALHSGAELISSDCTTLSSIPSALASETLHLSSSAAAGCSERPLFVDNDCEIFGIVTEPHPAARSGHGVLLLNDGATHHIGSSRMAVRLARRWARMGYVVLRVDLAGLGDSASHPVRAGTNAYPAGAMADIGAAAAFMRRQLSVSHLTLSGLCSGAYHALQAAASGLPVNQVLAVNPLIFYWQPEGLSEQEIKTVEAIHNTQRYRRHALSRATLIKILTGHINLRRMLALLGSRIALWMPWTGRQHSPTATPRTGGAADRNASDLRRRMRDFDLGKQLAAAASRAVRLHFIFSRGESGLEILQMLAESSLRRLAATCRIYQIEGADHIFSQSEPRARLEELLSDILKPS